MADVLNHWSSKGLPRQKAFLTMVLAVLLLSNGPVCQADDTKTSNPGKINAGMAEAPIGTVPAAEALRRIENHKKTIEDRITAMEALYDLKPSVATLTEAFRRNNVSASAMDYAKSWGENGLYLQWYAALDFYRVHRKVLEDSIYDIRSKKLGTVKRADLVYLDQGMASWIETEKTVENRLRQYADVLAQKAVILGHRHEVGRQMQASPEARKQLQHKYDTLGKMANDIDPSADALEQELSDIGRNTRLFSAIYAKDRMPVATITPKPPRENGKCSVVPDDRLPRLVPPPMLPPPFTLSAGGPK